MAPFEFSLDPVDACVAKGLATSWYNLSCGRFWIDLGDEQLLPYSPEILAAWGQSEPHPDYQIAACAREVLFCGMPALAPLPPAIEALASNWTELRRFERACWALVRSTGDAALKARHYTTWRWLGERWPNFGFWTVEPCIGFLRIGDSVRIGFDHDGCAIDGVRVWAAPTGILAMPVERFRPGLRSFRERLLTQMEERLQQLERGYDGKVTEDARKGLWTQHREWETEFDRHEQPRGPDIAWDETWDALRAMASLCHVELPEGPTEARRTP